MQNMEQKRLKEKERYQRNKAHIQAVNKIWREANREYLRESKHEDYERRKAADPGLLPRQRVTNRRNYLAKREERLVQCATWAKANPDKKHASRIRRRLRLLAVSTTTEKIDRRAIYVRDGGRCHICGLHVPYKVMTLDHLIPLLHGGPDIAINLAVAHRSCNARRGTGRLPAQLRLFG